MAGMFEIFRARGTVEVDDSGVDRGLAGVKRKVQETVARVDAMEGTAQLKADSSQLDREVDKTRAKLRSLDRQRATATADLDPTQFDVAEKKLRMKLRRLEAEKVEIDVRMGKDMKLLDKSLVGLVRRLRGVGQNTPWQDMQKLGDAMHNARITMGPLSLSLRGLMVALVALAPIVAGLIGSLAGLTASLGTAIVGAAGLGAAGLAAFGLQALGIGLILRPMVKDLSSVIKAQKAYNKAVSDYGKGSKQAQTAQEKLRSNLKATSPELRGSFKDLQALSNTWTRMTKSVRPEFFKTVAAGIKTARDLMPTFASKSKEAFTNVAHGMRDWLQGLRSAESKNILGNIMGRANAALKPLMAGLGQLATFLGRVFQSFSRFFKPLAQDFNDWASGLAKGAGNGKNLNGVVDELVASFKSWVGLIGATGRLIGNFFMAGSKSGRGMVKDITGLVNKWADWLGSKKGQKDLKKFLDDAWDTTKKLFKTIGDLVTAISDLATAGKPIADFFIDATGWALRLFHRIGDATGAGQGLVTTLAGLVILRKAIGWASALMSILGGGFILRGLKGFGKGILQRIIFGAGGVAGAIGGVRAGLMTVLRGALGGLGGAVTGALAGFKVSEWLGLGGLSESLGAVKRTFADIKGAGTAAFNGLKSAASNAWGSVRRQVGRTINFVFRIPSDPIGAARRIWNRVKGTLGRAIMFAFNVPNPLGAARSIWNRVKSVISSAIGFAFSLPNPISAARSIWNRVKSIISSGIQFVINLPGVGGLVSIASSIWNAVKSALPDITLHISIPTPSLPHIPNLNPFKGHASGAGDGHQGDPVTPAQAARALASPSVGPMGGKIDSPRFINNFKVVGEEKGNSEFVIPTNPNYRGRARKLLADAVAVIGTGFARGAAAGDKHRKKKQKKHPNKVYSGSHYLREVRSLNTLIDQRDNAYTNADRTYNTDARFRPMVNDDGQRIESNINWHLKRLDDLANRANELAMLERKLANAIEKANKQLHNAMTAWRRKRPASTLVKSDKKGKKTRVDNPAFKTWATKMEDLQSATGEVPLSDAAQARFRANDYDSDAYAYRADQREARDTKSAPIASGGLEGWLAGAGMLEQLKGLNLNLAKASATINDSADDRAANAALGGFWESVINRLGPRGDKDLLAEAYNNLGSARSGAADTGAGGGATIGEQIASLDAARSDLYRNFGSNFATSSGGILGAITGGVTQGIVAGLSGGGAGGAAPTGPAGNPQQGTTINQTNTFAAPPPDPHTFVQAVKWEAQAAL